MVLLSWITILWVDWSYQFWVFYLFIDTDISATVYKCKATIATWQSLRHTPTKASWAYHSKRSLSTQCFSDTGLKEAYQDQAFCQFFFTKTK